MHRHEQHTVRKALAAALHHGAGLKEKVELQQNAAPRGQTTSARAREGEVHEKNDALWRQNTPHPWRGRASSRSLGRRGATAVCGAPQGKLLSWVCHRWLVRLLKPSMVAPSGSRSPWRRRKEEDEERRREDRGAGGSERDGYCCHRRTRREVWSLPVSAFRTPLIPFTGGRHFCENAVTSSVVHGLVVVDPTIVLRKVPAVSRMWPRSSSTAVVVC